MSARSMSTWLAAVASTALVCQNVTAQEAESPVAQTLLAPQAQQIAELEPSERARAQGFVVALAAAMRFDPSLQVAYARYLEEQEDDDISLAALLPQISASGGYQYESSDNIYSDKDSKYYDAKLPRSSGELVDSDWRIDITQKVFDQEAYRSYKRDKALVKSAEYRYQHDIQKMVYTVTESYLAVLLEAQKVYLTEQKLDALELKKRQADRAKQLGVGDPLSVLRVTAARDLARSDMLQARSTLKDAKTRLKNLTGENIELPQGWVEGAQQINWMQLADAVQTLESGVVGNLELRQNEQMIAQARFNLSAQKAGHYPKVTLNISHQDKQSEDTFRERKDSVATLQLRMPIYSGGRQAAMVRKARARLQASQAQYDLVLAQKKQKVELALNSITTITERLAALQESKRSNQGYLDAAERQIALSVGDQIAVLDARTELLDTELAFAKTLHEFLLAELVLRLETGVLKAKHLATYDTLYNSAAIQ